MKMKLLFLAAALVFSRLAASAQSNPDSTNATDVELELAWPDGAVYTSAVHDMETIFGLYGGPGVGMTSVNNANWEAGAGGTGERKVAYQNPPPDREPRDFVYYWGAGQWPGFGDGYFISLPSGNTNETTSFPWLIHDQYVSSDALYGEVNFETLDGTGSLNFNDQSEISLITGGDTTSADSELYAISGTAVGITFTNPSLPDGIQEAIPPEQIQIGSLGSLTATSTNGSFISGTLFAVLPKHKTVPITPQVQGAKYREAVVSAQGYLLISQCVATTPANRSRNTVGVGEQVALYFNPTLPTNIIWSVSGGGTLSTNYGKTNFFTAPDVAATCTITMKYPWGSTPVKKNFYVQAPADVKFTKLGVQHTQGACEAGFHAGVTILNTNVSFYNVEFSEMNCTATATGCWAFENGLVHQTWTQQGAGWLTPNQNNTLATNVDYVRAYLSVPNGPGTFVWPIPWNYRKHGATNDGHYFKTLTMTATATDTDCTVNKNNMTQQFNNNAPTVNY
jgi:hypothetical protein